MTVHAMIISETPVQLWGLSSRQRLERILKKIEITSWIDNPGSLPAGDSVIILRGDYLYDERIIRNLAARPGTILMTEAEGTKKGVSAHVTPQDLPRTLDFLDGNGNLADLASLSQESPQTLAGTYMQKLRKIDPPYLLPITEENRLKLEKRLFSGSYKGVTDLVTKWLWPRPAQVVTRFCALRGITPNQVTSLSLILVIIAGTLFLKGHFALGLLAAWTMTFLDTVDGKLARVTVNSSTFGHLFDHIIDLVSPPLWYLAWGFGLASWQTLGPISLKAAICLIFTGYIGGRVAEGIFQHFLEPSGIFCWRPIDSYFRLITGRRNPNLILLTLGLIALRPDLGLLAVTIWTVASSIFLLVRLIMGFITRISKGPLRSWFLDIDPDTKNPGLAQRCFSNIVRD